MATLRNILLRVRNHLVRLLTWSQTIEIVGGRFQDGTPENASS